MRTLQRSYYGREQESLEQDCCRAHRQGPIRGHLGRTDRHGRRPGDQWSGPERVGHCQRQVPRDPFEPEEHGSVIKKESPQGLSFLPSQKTHIL